MRLGEIRKFVDDNDFVIRNTEDAKRAGSLGHMIHTLCIRNGIPEIQAYL